MKRTTRKPPEPKKDEEVEQKRINLGQIAFWVSLISGVLAIAAYSSGIQSIPELLSLVSGNRATPTFTPLPPTPTLEAPLEPLLKGTLEIPIAYFSRTFRLGYNFKLGQVASGNTPADVVFMNCSASSPSFDLYCDLRGKDIWNEGNMNLSDIVNRVSRGIDTLPNEVLEVGEAYVLQAYDGHPVKFRISNLSLIPSNETPTSAVVIMEYVYQTNNRQDFREP